MNKILSILSMTEKSRKCINIEYIYKHVESWILQVIEKNGIKIDDTRFMWINNDTDELLCLCTLNNNEPNSEKNEGTLKALYEMSARYKTTIINIHSIFNIYTFNIINNLDDIKNVMKSTGLIFNNFTEDAKYCNYINCSAYHYFPETTDEKYGEIIYWKGCRSCISHNINPLIYEKKYGAKLIGVLTCFNFNGSVSAEVEKKIDHDEYDHIDLTIFLNKI